MRPLLLTTLLCTTLCATRTAAQKVDTVSNFKVEVNVPKRFYVGSGLDFALLSTSITSRPGESTYLTIPRFTAIVNLGFSFNYDLTEHFGIMTGVGLRNIGFIEKYDDLKVKRRVYALGIPLGIKIGDLRNRNFIFAGGGIDLPFHYKVKSFTSRSKKEKEGEWFGDQTPRIMPFVFIGHSWDPGVTLKLQYYPGNFLNPNYETTDASGYTSKPFTDYKVNLLLLSLGFDIHYGQYKIQQREYLDLKKKREQRKLEM